MNDLYGVWRARCGGAADAAIADLILPTLAAPIPGENPQAGFWKMREKPKGPLVLMQIWLVDANGKAATTWADGLQLRGVIGKRSASADELAERWLFVKGHATKDEAKYWRENGRWATDPEPLPSGNMPGDPYLALLQEHELRLEEANAILKAGLADQQTCDKAKNLHGAICDLRKRADKMFDAEKEPIRVAGKAVDSRYRFRDALEATSKMLLDAVGNFLEALEREEQRKAAEAHAAEVARVEAERKAAIKEHEQLVDSDPFLHHGSEPELPPMPPPPAPVKVSAGGGVGQKAGLQDGWDWTITDYKAAAMHVILDRGVQAAVGKALQARIKATKGKEAIPGVEIIPRRKAA